MADQKSEHKKALNRALRSVFLHSGYAGASVARLAAATDLGKASLYHHYPGGKDEMAGTLLREAVASLQQQVFAPLAQSQPADQALSAAIDGFVDYVQGGDGNCLVAQFAQEHAPVVEQATLAAQYQDWHSQLAARYEELGHKPKPALRAARRLLAELYGALLMANLLGEPKELRRAAKRLKADLG